MTVGERIKQARREKGFTQKLLGTLSGTSEGTVRQYEIGKRQPRIEQLQKIADALDIPIGELIGTTPQPDRDYELVCDTLADAGLSIESTGFNDGTGSDGDLYYVWHSDTDSPEEDRVEYAFRDLFRIVRTVQKDADARKEAYIRKRLEAEIF